MKRIAVLLGADGERYVVPLLDKVKLLAVNDRGLLLTGIEVHPPRGSKGSGPVYPQTWWCVLCGEPTVSQGSSAEARLPELVRQAHEIGRTMSSHYARRR